jgi:hypothetical protein
MPGLALPFAPSPFAPSPFAPSPLSFPFSPPTVLKFLFDKATERWQCCGNKTDLNPKQILINKL